MIIYTHGKKILFHWEFHTYMYSTVHCIWLRYDFIFVIFMHNIYNHSTLKENLIRHIPDLLK